ncbi:unnamed protein product [Sphagnum tenellum]
MVRSRVSWRAWHSQQSHGWRVARDADMGQCQCSSDQENADLSICRGRLVTVGLPPRLSKILFSSYTVYPNECRRPPPASQSSPSTSSGTNGIGTPHGISEPASPDPNGAAAPPANIAPSVEALAMELMEAVVRPPQSGGARQPEGRPAHGLLGPGGGGQGVARGGQRRRQELPCL